MHTTKVPSIFTAIILFPLKHIKVNLLLIERMLFDETSNYCSNCYINLFFIVILFVSYKFEFPFYFIY